MLLFLTSINDPFLALDGAGAPLPEAELRFYVSGTLAPAEVYDGADLGTPIVQPVTADENGEFELIYLDPAVDYRATLQRADGTLVWDVDPYEIDDSASGRNLFRGPKVQALDGDGGPIPGATMTFYTTGTSAKRDTFADSLVETPHPNPISADAGGFFPPIYLSGMYKVAPSWSGEVDPYPPTPVPAILSLDPDEVEAGGGDFTLTITGQNFNEDSVGQVNGSDRVTVFISETELEVTVLEADIAAEGDLDITVENTDTEIVSNTSVLAVTAPAVTFDPATHSDAIVLSNGNLTATRQANNNNVFASVRATIGKSSGKWYWEYTIGVNGQLQHMPGSARSTLPNTNYPGQTSTSYGWQSQRSPPSATTIGLMWNNAMSTQLPSLYDHLTNPVIGIALDMDNGKLWFHVNGNYTNYFAQTPGDPAAGTNPAFSGLSGTMFPAYGLFRSATLTNLVSVTANFGASAFAYSVPSGFSALQS